MPAGRWRLWDSLFHCKLINDLQMICLTVSLWASLNSEHSEVLRYIQSVLHNSGQASKARVETMFSPISTPASDGSDGVCVAQ